jgi:glycogen synthase
VARERLPEIYLAADCYAMLSRFDTFGMVVLEAMAAGLPVLVSGCVGARDLVQEGANGFVVKDPGDADAVAERIGTCSKEISWRGWEPRPSNGPGESWDTAVLRVLGGLRGILYRRLPLSHRLPDRRPGFYSVL